MLLKELLKDIYAGPFPRGPRGSPREESSLRVTAIGCDSRTTGQGSLFVALKGTRQDGTQFIDEAIKKGARVVASSHPPAPP
jgi:UDP-N-acetylmuramoyl-L-alanyl-D-glutamate--2,6-diaminopimelate ligase